MHKLKFVFTYISRFLELLDIWSYFSLIGESISSEDHFRILFYLIIFCIAVYKFIEHWIEDD